jgi:hypothetical protein
MQVRMIAGVSGMSIPTPPGLEGLLDLACRDGIDIRPTLLRVLTDLYVQKPVHTPQEERHYVELAQRLIETVDSVTRAGVIARLRTYRAVPVALRPHLGPDHMSARVSDSARDIPVARSALLDRAAAPLPPKDIVAGHPAPAPRASRAALPPVAADSPSIVAVPEPPAPPTPAELCELFFAAESEERRLILIHLDAAAIAAKAKTTPLVNLPETIRHMEAIALRHDRGAFAREVMALFGLHRRNAQRIVDDASGEPVLVVAKALGMPAAMLQRILLFLNPTVGQSVQRVYDLAALYEEISVAAAHYMMSIFRKAAPPDRPAHPAARLQPALQNDDLTGPREPVTRRLPGLGAREGTDAQPAVKFGTR